MRRVSQPGSRGRPGEADAGERRHHEVEGVGGIAAVGARVGQRPDQVEVLERRDIGQPCVQISGSASGSGERTWRKCTRWPSIVGRELRVRVEPRLLRAPVEARAPVVDQLAHVVERHAVGPADVWELVGPARARQALRRSSRSACGISTRNGWTSVTAPPQRLTVAWLPCRRCRNHQRRRHPAPGSGMCQRPIQWRVEQTNPRWEGFPSDVLVDLRPQQGRGLRERLEHGLRAAIQSRRLVAGAALPPTRVLAAELGISRSVVVAAYANLSRRRLPRGAPGRRHAGATRRRAGAAPPRRRPRRPAAPGSRRCGWSGACRTPRSSPAPSGCGTTAPRWPSCPTRLLTYPDPRGATRLRGRADRLPRPRPRRDDRARPHPRLRRRDPGPHARLPRAAPRRRAPRSRSRTRASRRTARRSR